MYRPITTDLRAGSADIYLDHFPKELVEGTHDSLMQVRYKNGSLFQIVGVEDPDILVGTNPRGIVFSEYSLQNPSAQTSLPVVCGGRLSGLGDY